MIQSSKSGCIALGQISYCMESLFVARYNAITDNLLNKGN
jgi:hypothetical protein